MAYKALRPTRGHARKFAKSVKHAVLSDRLEKELPNIKPMVYLEQSCFT